MKTAFMFPGQGAQAVGMGKDFYDHLPAAKALFDAASEALGFSMPELCFAEANKLNETAYTQPALLTASMAALTALEGLTPDVALGLSLGEYSALAAAGAIGFVPAVKLVRKRGQFMTEACPPGIGAMSAVLNATRELVMESCAEASGAGVVTAVNFNMPGQIVIAGEAAAVEKAEELAKAKGAKRCMRLNVSGAFHSALMAPAAEKLLKELETVEFKPMNVPVVSNLTGEIIANEKDIAQILYRQVQSPVEWENSVRGLIGRGADTFVEVGPGKTLTGFVKKIAADMGADVTLLNVYDMESARSAKEKLSC